MIEGSDEVKRKLAIVLDSYLKLIFLKGNYQGKLLSYCSFPLVVPVDTKMSRPKELRFTKSGVQPKNMHLNSMVSIVDLL